MRVFLGVFSKFRARLCRKIKMTNLKQLVKSMFKGLFYNSFTT